MRPMLSKPPVATVIVHWGSPEITMECLRSVRASHYQNLDIVVVDNCPERRLWQNPSEADRTVVYIQAATNTGYCGGNNLGIQRARALAPKYIMLLNNDTIVDPDLIRNCVAYMEDQPDVHVISPKILFYDRPEYINLAGGSLDPDTGDIRFFGGNERDVGQCEQEREITWATGCALFARECVFERVGLFDEALFTYGEDVDLSRRILLAGMTMRYYPAAKVWHKCSSMEVEDNTSVPTTLATYYIWRNRLHYVKRYVSKKRAKGYSLFAFRFLWKFASFALKHRRLDLCLAMLLGLADSIAGRMGKREYSFFEVPMAAPRE
jgi:GT2 family glycosyltransferase